MFINDHQTDWTDVFNDTAITCTASMRSIVEQAGSVSCSLRDAGLLAAQITLSNSVFSALVEGETSDIDKKFIKTTLSKTCCGQLDNRTGVFIRISDELADIKFLGQIPLRLLRKILEIASGRPDIENDQFLSAFSKSLNSIHVPLEKLLTSTPPLPPQGEFDLSNSQAPSSRIRTRKSRTSSKIKS